MKYNEPAEIGILGTLNEQGPKTLDSVRGLLQRNFEQYWGFGTGVVSPTVRKLEEEGYIDASAASDGDYAYHITPEGEDRLHELIRTVFSDEERFEPSKRHHILITLGFLHHLPEREQVAVLDTVEAQLSSELDRLMDVTDTPDSERTVSDVDVGYRRDLVQLNITMLESLLEWVRGLEVKSPE